MSKQRKVWFITRPERDPKFHRDALLALAEATNDFTIKWAGNRVAHQNYEKELNLRNIKRQNISNDGSGGRTWAAMLKTFSYVYTDEEGYLKLTKVGRKIIDGVKVRENVTKQILTLQIPNAYFLEKGFRPQYEDGFRIRPARFIIRLTNQSKLDYYLTKEEITFFALVTKKDSDLEEVTKNIIQFRNGSNLEKAHMKQVIAETYDHRERSDKGARDFATAHGDVAHTFMLISEYTGLVDYVRGDALRIDPIKSKWVEAEVSTFDIRFPFNTRYLISLHRLAENNGLDIDSYKANSYGDTKPATNKAKIDSKINELLSDYPAIDDLSHNDIESILKQEFSSKESTKYAYEVKQTTYSTINEDFVEGYINEDNDLAFETKTGQVFKAIGFDVVMRPKPIVNVSTEIEILLKVGDNLCCLIDAKNYRTKFNLSSNLVSHMASEYIPNYEGYDNREVAYFGYVTASGIGGERNLEKISNLVRRIIPNRDIKGIMLSANVLLGFLDYCIENNLSKKDRIHLFLSTLNNKAYTSFGELLREIQ